jgi:hypothetical protein
VKRRSLFSALAALPVIALAPPMAGCGLPAQSVLDIASSVVGGLQAAAGGIGAFIDDVVKPPASVVAEVGSLVSKIQGLCASAQALIGVAKGALSANITALIASAQLLYKSLLDLTAQFGVHPTGAASAAPSGAPSLEVPPASAFSVAK